MVTNIDGVSDRVVANLDDEFGTATEIADASVAELKNVDGIGPVLARRIWRRTNSAVKHPERYSGDAIHEHPHRTGVD